MFGDDLLIELMPAIIYFSVLALIILLCIQTRRGWKHKWIYHNPYRTCRICGRHEVDFKVGKSSTWVVFDEGTPHIHFSLRRYMSERFHKVHKRH